MNETSRNLINKIEEEQFGAELAQTARNAAQTALDKRREDPAPDALLVAHERAETLVKQLSSSAMLELKALRDDIDNLMRTFSEQQTHLIGQIKDHASFVEASIKSKTIITEALQRLQQTVKVTNVSDTKS